MYDACLILLAYLARSPSFILSHCASCPCPLMSQALYRLPEFDSRLVRALKPAVPVPERPPSAAPVPASPHPISAARPPSAAAQQRLASPPPIANRRTSSLSAAPSDAATVLANAGSLLHRYASMSPAAVDTEELAMEEEYGATLLHSAAGQVQCVTASYGRVTARQ
jgi:hypothetical protein